MMHEIQGPLYRADGAESGNTAGENSEVRRIFTRDFLDKNPKDAQERLRAYWLGIQDTSREVVISRGLDSDASLERKERFEQELRKFETNAREAANIRKSALRIKNNRSGELDDSIGGFIELFYEISKDDLHKASDTHFHHGFERRKQRQSFSRAVGEYVKASYNTQLFNTAGDRHRYPEGHEHHTSEQLRTLIDETSWGLIPLKIPGQAFKASTS